MGINLRGCSHPDIAVFNENVYSRILCCAENLVKTTEDIQNLYGIPIINKRISVTPIAIVAESCRADDLVSVAETLDRAAHDAGIDFIGGFSALVQKGMTPGDLRLINSIPRALATTRKVCSSVNVATTKAGINMDAVAKMGHIIREAAELTRDSGGIGCAKLVVFANAPKTILSWPAPFMVSASLTA